MDIIGYGSLNIDEFWEVDRSFITEQNFSPGEEYVKSSSWFEDIYPILQKSGRKLACDPGGSAANTIAALNRMGFETGFFGMAGKADHEFLRLRDLGDFSHVIYSDLPSGRCLSLIIKDDHAKDRILIVTPNANDFAIAAPNDLSFFKTADRMHLTSFVSSSPLSSQISVCSQMPETVKISFDPGSIYCSLGLAAVKPILMRTEILFITMEELERLTERSEEEALILLQNVGVRTIVVKRGQYGISVFHESEAIHQPVIKPKAIVDRTGAGDVAAAGFLAGLLNGKDLTKCAALAALAASISIEGYGRESYPTRKDLKLI